MKRNIKKIIILLIIMLFISSIIILLQGKTFTTSFKIREDGYKLEIDNTEGEIEILDELIQDDNYIIKFKSKKPGKVFISVNNKDYAEQKLFYVHKTMIITENNYFGYSKGTEIIPISISILLIYICYLLIKEYKKNTEENLYQYKNVAYLGIIIFISSFIISNLLSIINYKGIYETINKTINSMSVFSLVSFPVAIVTFVLVTISNIRLIKKEGMSLRNLLGLFFGVFICILPIIPDKIYEWLMKAQIVNIYNLNSPGPYIYNFMETIVYLTVSYLECIFIGTIIIAIKSVKKKIKYNKDYIIILGSQIKKDGTLTPLLKERVDRAIRFRDEQLKATGKDLIFIPSGGQGNDEIMPESVAMKKYLIENGIKEKQIIIEDKSKNTYENIKFSNNLIKIKDANIAFSTTNYHVFRAGLLATEQGLYLEGVGGKTKTYFWINAFIREFIGTLYSERLKHITVFTIISIIMSIMILITYFANNI